MILGAAIYVCGLYLASASNSAGILSSLRAGPQIMIWAIWSATGMFFNYYTIALFSWLALGVLLGNLIQRR